MVDPGDTLHSNHSTTSEESEIIKSFDDIRFASYRTACKLRTIQKWTKLSALDIWNLIEAFREIGLNEFGSYLSTQRLKLLLSVLYDSLSKRLPPSGSSLQKEADILEKWILKIVHSDKLKVRTVKTILATLCAGKLMDKLRYIFSQISDDEGHYLIISRFNHFLSDVSKIPESLDEASSFLPSSSFEQIFESGKNSGITVNDFLETMMSDPGPQSLSWLLVLHRISNAESVIHPVMCNSCSVKGFSGLRYKSDRTAYQLCQSCFWRGRISEARKDDVFKEYNSYKSSHGRSSSSSFKRSLQCIHSSTSEQSSEILLRSKNNTNSLPHFPNDTNSPVLHLRIPSSPSSLHSGIRAPPTHPKTLSLSALKEDEHALISEYASHLNEESSALFHSRQLVIELERKNQEIIQDMSQLRLRGNSTEESCKNPELVSELVGLRSRKESLEHRLTELQETRKDLMNELEELTKLLKSSSSSSKN